MIWTLECKYLLNVVLSFYSRHIPRNRMHLSYMVFIVLGCIPCILTLLRVSIINGCYISSNAILCIFWNNHMIFILQLKLLYHIAVVELFWYPWNKSHLIVVCDPLNVLLSLVCQFYWRFLHLLSPRLLACNFFFFDGVFVWDQLILVS